jgi:hypothetical protein
MPLSQTTSRAVTLSGLRNSLNRDATKIAKVSDRRRSVAPERSELGSVESCRCDCGADRSAPAQRLDAIGRAFMSRDDRSGLDHHTLKSAPWRGLPYLSVPIVKEPHWPSSLPEICLMRPSLLTWQHGGGSFSRQPHRASGHRSGRPPSHAGRARHLECATPAATIQGRTVGRGPRLRARQWFISPPAAGGYRE